MVPDVLFAGNFGGFDELHAVEVEDHEGAVVEGADDEAVVGNFVQGPGACAGGGAEGLGFGAGIVEVDEDEFRTGVLVHVGKDEILFVARRGDEAAGEDVEGVAGLA